MADIELHRRNDGVGASYANRGAGLADECLGRRPICPMGFSVPSLNRTNESVDPPLSDVLRDRTKSLHAVAERSGVIADILQRRSDRGSYVLLLRNLLPAYECLEAELSARSDNPVLGIFAHHSLRRSDRLRSDLCSIQGADWEQSLPLLKSGAAYAADVMQAARGDGLRLASHAYVRYLGDLSGGQVLKKLVGKSLSLPASALSVYEFPDVDTPALKSKLRGALDRAGRVTDDPHMLVIEAMTAFEHNIRVSREVRDKARADAPVCG